MSNPTVGLLALQGATLAHARAFARLGIEATEVRTCEELANVSHLVVPGGESTTLHHLTTLYGLAEAIQARHREDALALFGTCAGAILLSYTDEKPPGWQLLDASIQRNAYGRQAQSEYKRIRTEEDGDVIDGLFIRAPRFVRIGPGVRVLARCSRTNEPVAVEAEGIVATTFHPELGEDLRFHRHFLQVSHAKSHTTRSVSNG